MWSRKKARKEQAAVIWTRRAIVPDDLIPALLVWWDKSADVLPTAGNMPMTLHARMMWTARQFCANEGRGRIWGQAGVFADLGQLLTEAERTAKRLQGDGA